MRVTGPFEIAVRGGQKAFGARCAPASKNPALPAAWAAGRKTWHGSRAKSAPRLQVELVCQDETRGHDPFWDAPRLLPAFVAQVMGQVMPERREHRVSGNRLWQRCRGPRMALVAGPQELTAWPGPQERPRRTETFPPAPPAPGRRALPPAATRPPGCGMAAIPFSAAAMMARPAKTTGASASIANARHQRRQARPPARSPAHRRWQRPAAAAQTAPAPPPSARRRPAAAGTGRRHRPARQGASRPARRTAWRQSADRAAPRRRNGAASSQALTQAQNSAQAARISRESKAIRRRIAPRMAFAASLQIRRRGDFAERRAECRHS